MFPVRIWFNTSDWIPLPIACPLEQWYTKQMV